MPAKMEIQLDKGKVDTMTMIMTMIVISIYILFVTVYI